MNEIDVKMKEADALIKNAKGKDLEIDSVFSQAIKDIETFEKEIIRRVAELKKKVINEAQMKKTKDKQAMQKATESVTKFSLSLKQAQTSVTSAKASKEEGQLYISLTRSRAALKSREVYEAQQSLDRVDTQYIFECNTELDSILDKISSLGNLITHESEVIAPKKKTFCTLKYIGYINVRTKSDKRPCNITGCAVLSSDKVVLADNYNNKIKLLDTQRKIVEREKALGTWPADVTVLPDGQIATTLPLYNEILLMDSDSQLTLNKTIPLKQDCWGITYHDAHLYVTCREPECVLILDVQGNIIKNIDLSSASQITHTEYIVCSKDSNQLYISDPKSYTVTSVTLQGRVIAKHEHRRRPRGMAVLENGSLLVCCRGNGNVNRISGDLKECCTVVKGLFRPQLYVSAMLKSL